MEKRRFFPIVAQQQQQQQQKQQPPRAPHLWLFKPLVSAAGILPALCITAAGSLTSLDNEDHSDGYRASLDEYEPVFSENASEGEGAVGGGEGETSSSSTTPATTTTTMKPIVRTCANATASDIFDVVGVFHLGDLHGRRILDLYELNNGRQNEISELMRRIDEHTAATLGNSFMQRLQALAQNYVKSLSTSSEERNGLGEVQVDNKKLQVLKNQEVAMNLLAKLIRLPVPTVVTRKIGRDKEDACWETNRNPTQKVNGYRAMEACYFGSPQIRDPEFLIGDIMRCMNKIPKYSSRELYLEPYDLELGETNDNHLWPKVYAATTTTTTPKPCPTTTTTTTIKPKPCICESTTTTTPKTRRPSSLAGGMKMNSSDSYRGNNNMMNYQNQTSQLSSASKLNIDCHCGHGVAVASSITGTFTVCLLAAAGGFYWLARRGRLGDEWRKKVGRETQSQNVELAANKPDELTPMNLPDEF